VRHQTIMAPFKRDGSTELTAPPTFHVNWRAHGKWKLQLHVFVDMSVPNPHPRGAVLCLQPSNLHPLPFFSYT
jgi:hypothetical protein